MAQELLFEVSVTVDDDEMSTEELQIKKEREIRRAIESLDCSVGIFVVENRIQ